MNTTYKLLLSGGLLILSGISNAALVTRLGGQAVYDTDKDITWIANANLADTNTFGLQTEIDLGAVARRITVGTNIIKADGRMNWAGALHWIDAMNQAAFLGANNWWLPKTDIICGASFNCNNSDLGHLYYDEFSVTGGQSVTTGNPVELAKFQNLQDSTYWNGEDFGPDPTFAWDFLMSTGIQGFPNKSFLWYSLAVRDGDLSSVPIPGAVWLFGSGLFGLTLSRHRQLYAANCCHFRSLLQRLSYRRFHLVHLSICR